MRREVSQQAAMSLGDGGLCAAGCGEGRGACVRVDRDTRRNTLAR